MMPTKIELRRSLRQRRRALSPLTVAAAGQSVYRRIWEMPSLWMASALVSYVAAEAEVQTAAIHARFLASDRPVFFPGHGSGAKFLRWQPSVPLQRRNRFFGPARGEELSREVRFVALLPLVGWSETGWRLGRGGGFYDRAFSPRPPNAVLVGLAYEFQRVAQPISDPWDVGLDFIVTERRSICCSESVRIRPERSESAAKPWGFNNHLET